MEEFSEKLNSLAKDVMMLSRNTLLVNLRFMDMALSQLELVPIPDGSLGTDAKKIYYNPRHVLLSYKDGKEIPVRNYLHMVMHCVFGHMFMNPSIDREYWDLACDIAVENVITELQMKAVSTEKEALQRKVTGSLKDSLKFITAEKVYDFLMSGILQEEQLEELSGLFGADDHGIWYAPPEPAGASGQSGGSDDKSDKPNKSSDSKAPSSSDSSGNSGQGQSDSQESQGTGTQKESLADVWKDIADKLKTDLETFSKDRGDQAGAMMQNLTAVTREKYDYESFLRKFASLCEVMKVNDDEFDYIFYTYGLALYKKMPLIEPLEYKEVKRVREFVIAIDTSGSTSGELVQTFVQKTYNILKSTESFYSKINVHIIQCDAMVQEHVKITTQEEFDKYLETLTIKGLGGTDFRPVFEMVDQLIADKEFVNLKGMIYFTDGNGIFPEHKPGYETAFVFIDDNYNNPIVPPWAIKLVLQTDEI